MRCPHREMLPLALAAWLLGPQKPERRPEVAIPNVDISLKAGWQVLFHDGCRVAVPLSWRADADGSFAAAADGSAISLRRSRSRTGPPTRRRCGALSAQARSYVRTAIVASGSNARAPRRSSTTSMFLSARPSVRACSKCAEPRRSRNRPCVRLSRASGRLDQPGDHVAADEKLHHGQRGRRAGLVGGPTRPTVPRGTIQNRYRTPKYACRGKPPPPYRFVSTRKFAACR